MRQKRTSNTSKVMLAAADKIRMVAKEEAQHLIDVANATTRALTESTAKDIARIQTDIEKINTKLDGTMVSKEEHIALIESIKTANAILTDADIDHEKRLRVIERYAFSAIGVLYVAVLIIGWYVSINK